MYIRLIKEDANSNPKGVFPALAQHLIPDRQGFDNPESALDPLTFCGFGA